MGKDVQKLGEGIQNTGYGTGWDGSKPSPYQQEPSKPVQP